MKFAWRVDRDEDGIDDAAMARVYVHLERMNDDALSLTISGPGGKYLNLSIWARGKVHITEQ